MRAITDVDNFVDPVTTLEDGDPVTETSTDPTTQALANRTRNLKNRIDAIAAALNTFSANSHRKGYAGGVVELGPNSEVVLGSGALYTLTSLNNGAGGSSAIAAVAAAAGVSALYALTQDATAIGLLIQAEGVGAVIQTSGSGHGISIDTKTFASGRAIYAAVRCRLISAASAQGRARPMTLSSCNKTF